MNEQVSSPVAARSPSLGDVLRAHKGLGPGFDTMRLTLSLAIMVVHSITLMKGIAYFDYRQWWGYPLFLALLPMFFGLSGFLVTGSAVRLRETSRFMLNRGFRIIPALAVEVTLSAIVLGAIVTTLPLAEYFAQPQFWAYFQNIIGIIHFELPGVFLDNPFPGTVNGNLWTLQPEYYCYLLLGALMWSRVFFRTRFYLSVIGLFSVALIIADLGWKVGQPFYAVSSTLLVFCFFVGSLIFLLSDRIPFDGRLALLAAVIYWALSRVPGGTVLAMLPLCYVTIYLGVCKLPKIRYLDRGDYSYGIYLYGFPIQQTLAHYFPDALPWWGMGAVSIVITIFFSMLSWHWIEKPILALKNRF